MARAFQPDGSDRYVAILDEDERAMVSGLMQQTRALLSPEIEPTGDVFADLAASMGGEGRPGERDPALERLLPTAHRGDDEIAAEFRRLTEEGLRQRKSAALDLAIESLESAQGDEVVLRGATAGAFLTALTDVRLLIGERVGIRTEEDMLAVERALEVIDDDDPLGYAMAWYDFLTWLQDTLSSAMLDALA